MADSGAFSPCALSPPQVAEMVEAFDEALGSLRREKFKLESDVKMAEMKQLVHYQVWTRVCGLSVDGVHGLGRRGRRHVG